MATDGGYKNCSEVDHKKLQVLMGVCIPKGAVEADRTVGAEGD